jgi:hypothetical protein
MKFNRLPKVDPRHPSDQVQRAEHVFAGGGQIVR